MREGNVGEEWQETGDSRRDNGRGSSAGTKQKLTQVATKAMKQYFEKCKKTNKVRETIFFYKSLEKKKESSNELTMARQHNEARKRKAKHQSRNREQTRSAKKGKKV